MGRNYGSLFFLKPELKLLVGIYNKPKHISYKRNLVSNCRNFEQTESLEWLTAVSWI